MIRADLAVVQLNRASGLPRFPELKAAWDEVVSAMREVSRSPEHCKLIMDSILRSAKWFPVPAEIYEAAETVLAPELAKPFEGFRECPVCVGTGFESAVWLVTWDGGKKTKQRITAEQDKRLAGKLGGIGVQEIYEGSDYCRCQYGNHLRTRRAMKEAEDELNQHAKGKR